MNTVGIMPSSTAYLPSVSQVPDGRPPALLAGELDDVDRHHSDGAASSAEGIKTFLTTLLGCFNAAMLKTHHP